jgi:hypothetical protein
MELSEPIRKLFSHPQAKPLKGLSKLLDCAHQIAFKTEKDAVEKVAEQIVNNTDLKMQEKYTTEQLSFLVNNVKKCNELAYERLCDRILSELKLSDYITIPFDKGSAFLVWDIYQYNQEKGQELTNRIFSLDFNKLFDRSETEAVSILIWNMLQVNGSKAQSWIRNIEEKKWLSKALSSSTHDAFRLLWSLYHADEERGKSVARSLANKIIMLPTLAALEVKDLPLLGFFIYCGIQFDLNIPIPSPHEIAEKVSADPHLSELAFCVCLLQKKNDKIMREFLKELGRCLFIKFRTFSIEELLEKHPFENTRQLLMEIFKDFDLPEEPESTFAEMICLTKTYLRQREKIKVGFSQLRDFFLSNPNSNPIFKSVNDSTAWLRLAVEYGIYHEEQVPHHKNPSGIVNLLSLNTDNRFVSSALMKN